MEAEKLYRIAEQLVQPKKGILAADQSARTMNKQLEGIGVAPEAEMRRKYRQLLFTTPGLEQYVSGIIMYDASIRNYTDAKQPFVDVLLSKGIIPIIKVDKSTVPMTGFPDEVVTQGLDGLAERLAEYHAMGARAAKWRAVIRIGKDIPTNESIKFNCLMLARYAALCQEAGIVPMVEPEVIYAGSHDRAKAEEVTELTLKTLFAVLEQYRVDLKAVILKSSMILAGSEYPEQSTPEEVAESSVNVFKNSVPAEVPGIVFLSGGQTPEQATANLNAIAKLENQESLPWQFAFSFSRGLEQPVQEAWRGQDSNVELAQQALIHRLELNVAADAGTYQKNME